MASEQEQVAPSNTPCATETSSIEPPTDINSLDDTGKEPSLLDVETANNFEPAPKKSKNEEMQPLDQSTPSVSNQYGDNYNGERGNISQYESPYKNPGDGHDNWHQNEPNRDYRSESRYDSYSYQHSNPPQRSNVGMGNADIYKDEYRSNYDIPPTTQPNSMASMGPTSHSYTSTDNRYPAQKAYDDNGRGNSLKSFYGESWNSYKNPPEKDFIGDTTDSHGYPSGKERWSDYDSYQRRDNDPNLSSTARNYDNAQYPDPNYQRHNSDSWYGEPSRHREQSAYSEQRAPKRTLESHALKSFFGSSLDTYYNPPENDYIGNSPDQPHGQDKDVHHDRDQFYEEMANYEASKISGNQDYDDGFNPDCPPQVKKPDYKSKEPEEGPTEDDFWNDPPDNLLASPPEDSDEEQKTEEHIPENDPVTPAYEDKKDDDYHSQHNYEDYREGYNNEPHAKNDYDEQANNYEEEYRSYYQSKCDKTYNTDNSNYENRNYSNYDNSNYENSEYVDQNNSYKNSSYDDRYETNYSNNSAPYYGDPNNVGHDGYSTNQNPSQQYNAY